MGVIGGMCLRKIVRLLFSLFSLLLPGYQEVNVFFFFFSSCTLLTIICSILTICNVSRLTVH